MSDPQNTPEAYDHIVGHEPEPEPMDIDAITVALAPLMRRAKGIRATMAGNEAAYAAEKLELDQKHAAIQQSEQMRLDSLMREIERLGRMRIAYEGDRKSVVLLHGQIGMRRQPTKVEIEDETKLVQALASRDIPVPWNKGPTPPPPTISKDAILKLIEAHNVEFPGATLVLGEDKFFFDEKVTDTTESTDARD